MQEQGYLSTGGQRLHYLKFGAGSRLLLAFHGYGNDAFLFGPLAGYLEDDYTVISVDLPHHGASDWDEDRSLSKEALAQFVQSLLLETGHPLISLAGYSMGGRFCLSILEMLPDRVERVLLIAPDGLRSNRFYTFLTGSRTGRRMFTGFLNGPRRYFRYIKWLHDSGMMDTSRYRLVMRSLGTYQDRYLLKRVWLNTRLLLPDSRKVKQHIKQYQIPVHIFMGRHDRLIPARLAGSFAKDLPEVTVHLLDKGHYLFDTDSLRVMAKCLL